ncbi:hypothetical protein B4144_4029 [Bacillus atrophaeus]|nr:hypothetical protein B4144_4029 [Bacillus atrophaeus]
MSFSLKEMMEQCQVTRCCFLDSYFTNRAGFYCSVFFSINVIYQ